MKKRREKRKAQLARADSIKTKPTFMLCCCIFSSLFFPPPFNLLLPPFNLASVLLPLSLLGLFHVLSLSSFFFFVVVFFFSFLAWMVVLVFEFSGPRPRCMQDGLSFGGTHTHTFPGIQSYPLFRSGQQKKEGRIAIREMNRRFHYIQFCCSTACMLLVIVVSPTLSARRRSSMLLTSIHSPTKRK